MDEEVDPTPTGLLRCLQVLAEEAMALRLVSTCSALEAAIEACRMERALLQLRPIRVSATSFH